MDGVNRMRAGARVAMAGAAVLYRFPPERYDFYPQCPIYRYLHVYCPGCGATRALAALLHLRIAEALHYNALVVLLVPVLLAYFAVACWKARRDEVFTWPRVPAMGLTALLVMSAAFGVLRNFLGSSLYGNHALTTNQALETRLRYSDSALCELAIDPGKWHRGDAPGSLSNYL